ncbi:MAG: DUF3160 domain-containing protein [Verrucomicrobiae bacterium]|nr:DUF3160 domain-containing protein [Verrucomicrobiae bacterium]
MNMQNAHPCQHELQASRPGSEMAAGSGRGSDGPSPLLQDAADEPIRCPGRILYAGPTLSHYEFWEPNGTRLTDEIWGQRVQDRNTPALPPWTEPYIVPSAVP